MQGKEAKRKLSSDSGESPDTKNARHGSTPPTVIDTIREATNVLLDDSITELTDNMPKGGKASKGSKVGKMDGENTQVKTMPDSSPDSSPNTSTPTDSSSPLNEHGGTEEILMFLRRIDDRLSSVDGRLQNVEKKLQKLDTLEAKVIAIDTDMTKLWNFTQDNFKSNEERVNKYVDQVDNLQFALGKANEQIDQLTEAQNRLNGEMDYIRSQSMRNNLVFGNIPEFRGERAAITEQKVREFMINDMGIASSVVDSIRIERAHRATQPPQGATEADFTPASTSTDSKPQQYGPPRKPRNVIVKFASFKDRELVRNSSKNLKGSCYSVYEQFPKSVSDKRRNLIPSLKEAHKNNLNAWLSYDKLYIEGCLQPDNITPEEVKRQAEAKHNAAGDISEDSEDVHGRGNRGRGHRGRGQGGRGDGGRGGRGRRW